MAFGEPVPGAEIFIEQEPLDDPVASGKTDSQGGYTTELKAGVYSVKVMLSAEHTRGLVAFGLHAQIKGQSGAIGEKVYPVAFTPGKSGPYIEPLSLPKGGSLSLRLRSLGARPPLAGAFEAGRDAVRHPVLGDQARLLDRVGGARDRLQRRRHAVRRRRVLEQDGLRARRRLHVGGAPAWDRDDGRRVSGAAADRAEENERADD